jgi:hypothetical protein
MVHMAQAEVVVSAVILAVMGAMALNGERQVLVEEAEDMAPVDFMVVAGVVAQPLALEQMVSSLLFTAQSLL